MYMCLDVACPLCSTCLQKCSACAPVLSSQLWCAFLSLLKPFGSERRLTGARKQATAPSAIAEIEWILAESSDTLKRKEVSCKPQLHHTVRQNWEGSHFRGSTAVSKRYNGSKSSSRVGCRTYTAGASRLDLSLDRLRLKSNP